LQIADDVCELVSPNGDGLLMRDMLRTGHGIRSTVYAVKDVAAGQYRGRSAR
jgi:hypothetical protein